VLTVDGKEVDRHPIKNTTLMVIDEPFDIGSDTRTPVDIAYDVPFRFTGSIDRLDPRSMFAISALR
jgi:arylsulfatase